MLKPLIVLILLSVLVACNKGKRARHGGEYVRGDVLTGIKGGTPIDSVFALFNRLDLQMKQVNGFSYVVPYPPEKLDSVSAYLNTKPYIDTFNWKVELAYGPGGKPPVYGTWFSDMDIARQADWLHTIDELHLADLQDSFSSVYLRVPPGTEQYWVDMLSKNSIIRWAELNNISHMVF